MYKNPGLSVKLEITAIRIGDLTIVTDIRRKAPEFIRGECQTMISSLTNGIVGYVGTKDALNTGGSESRLASNVKTPAKTDYVLSETAIKLINSLNN